MFWKKRATPASHEHLPPAERTGLASIGAAAHADDALDTVVSIFRSLGRFAFDLSNVEVAVFRRQCDAWAEHLAVGAPHPDTAPDSKPTPDAARDWAGAGRFVQKRRQDECDFVAKSVGDLREVVADLTERLATTLIGDQDADRRVSDQVERLRASANAPTLEDLRREVLSAADLLSGLVSERAERVRSQLVELDLKVSALSEELHEVKHESSLDGLTRVFNRGAFERTLTRLHRVGTLSAQPFCLMITDLDHLKQINDKHGHRTGDDALRLFADCLVRGFPRKSDFIGRYGGDEFVVILPQTRLDQSERLATRFLEATRRLEVVKDGTVLRLTASIGLAELKRGESSESWLERADRALYQAKTGGRDRLVVEGQESQPKQPRRA